MMVVISLEFHGTPAVVQGNAPEDVVEGGVGGNPWDHCPINIGEVRTESVDQQGRLIVPEIAVISIMLLIAVIMAMNDGSHLEKSSMVRKRNRRHS